MAPGRIRVVVMGKPEVLGIYGRAFTAVNVRVVGGTSGLGLVPLLVGRHRPNLVLFILSQSYHSGDGRAASVIEDARGVSEGLKIAVLCTEGEYLGKMGEADLELVIGAKVCEVVATIMTRLFPA